LGAAGGDTIPDDDALVVALRARDRVVDLECLGWHGAGTPNDARKPALAVPMYANAALTGFALYGAHIGGAAIDSDEAAQLERLADAASLAFEQLDAQQLRAENAQLRLQLRTLGG
jgi:hypothetical protein